MDRKEEIAENLAVIRKRIDEACLRAGRSPEEVTLVCVSKTKPLSDIVLAHELGENVFGENKVQEMCVKLDELASAGADGGYAFHLIGHLQTNKVKYIVGRTALIHSVDSIKLAREIDKESLKKNVITDILVEINIGSEESKFGVNCEDAYELCREIGTLKNVRLKGLMTVAPAVSDREEARPYFKKMRELFVDIGRKNYDNIFMNVLSMGMTGDYETAIEEGATLVRVGTGIFGQRDYSIH